MKSTAKGTGQIRRAASGLRLVVGRIRLFAPELGWARAAGLAVRDRRGQTGTIAVSWPGFAEPLQLRAGGSDLLTFHQVVACEGYRLPFDLDGPPSVIIDAGANIGLSSAWFAVHYPDATILAIEPELENFLQLLTNVAPYSNVVPVHGALWPTGGSVAVTDPSVGSFGFRTEVVDEGAAGAVPAYSVDRLVEEYGLARISIFKIDIEGAEKELFEGDTSWIDRVDAIAVELHDRFKPGCASAFAAATGAFTERHTDGHETFVRRPFGYAASG